MRWTLPNIITLSRICLTPVIALLPFIQGYWPKVIAFIIFLVAAFSDVLDGWLARRYNTVSDLGKLLDPIADKLLLFATLIPIFWMTRHPEDGDQRGEQQQLVGDRIEQLAEVAHGVVATRQPPVQDVRERGDEKDDEGDDLGPIALDEWQQGDDRREANARQRD